MKDKTRGFVGKKRKREEREERGKKLNRLKRRKRELERTGATKESKRERVGDGRKRERILVLEFFTLQSALLEV